MPAGAHVQGHAAPAARPSASPAAPDAGRTDWSAIEKPGFNPPQRVVQRPGWNRGSGLWWRGRRDFAGYIGSRPGYWYRPGHGYFRVEPRWFNCAWQAGLYVPVEFQSFYVEDPDEFGLPPPPDGYAYVFLGEDIALIALDTGLIVQLFPRVF
jgi:Ni/Co efflux regulator RcnB